MKTIQELFNEYKNARRHREHSEEHAQSILKPIRDALSFAKTKLYEAVDLYKSFESSAREELECTSRTMKDRGEFGEGVARYQLNGGYVEVQADKKTVTVVDLQAFLADPMAHDLIVSVKVNVAAIKVMNRVPDGIAIHKIPGTFKVSVTKEETSD